MTPHLLSLCALSLTLGLASGCGSSNPGTNSGVVSPQPRTEHVPASNGSQSVRPVDHASFWQLIAETREAANNDTGRQTALLEARLTQLSPRGVIRFAQIRHRLDERAYTWELWGAAYVIEDGCSDDCFRDFRAYLISLGRGPYERALHDPDSLVSVVQDAEAGDWENADDVAPDAYSSVADDDFPLDDSDLSGRPRGRPFDQDTTSLRLRYPRLVSRFR
jgi:Protein of unknown function (DUF4240)